MRWRLQFRCRGSRREEGMVQFSKLSKIYIMKIKHILQVILVGLIATIRSVEAQSVTNTVDEKIRIIEPQAINHLSASNNIPNANSKVLVESCVEQLKAIEIAKYQWGFFNSKRPDVVPTWDDIRPFFPRSFPKTSWTNGILVCPDGGTYTLGRLGVPPTCSIGGPGHSLPQ